MKKINELFISKNANKILYKWLANGRWSSCSLGTLRPPPFVAWARKAMRPASAPWHPALPSRRRSHSFPRPMECRFIFDFCIKFWKKFTKKCKKIYKFRSLFIVYKICNFKIKNI